MKKKVQFLSLLLILLVFSNLRMDAQTNDWQPIFNR